MGSVGNKEDAMNVPYNEWGEEISNKPIKDSNGDVIGYINDETRFEYESVIEKSTKKQVLDLINTWKMDDGTYGDEDTAIYVAYDDGRFLNLSDGEPHRRWSKQGIVGLSISTADDEAVWGGEMRNGSIQKWELSPVNEQAEGKTDSYLYYRTTNSYKVRVKETYNNLNPRTGRYETKREVIRQSTKKAYT